MTTEFRKVDTIKKSSGRKVVKLKYRFYPNTDVWVIDTGRILQGKIQEVIFKSKIDNKFDLLVTIIYKIKLPSTDNPAYGEYDEEQIYTNWEACARAITVKQ